MNRKLCEALIIGPGVVDIPLRPIGSEAFESRSYGLDSISMQVGGDAVNEAIILSRLGHSTMISSKVGEDAAGRYIINTLNDNHINTKFVVREKSIETGINIVLVREDGERSFITNRNGSLRKLTADDIRIALNSREFDDIRIVCLASMFVSPLLTCDKTADIFSFVKSKGKILCSDTTRCKNGERTSDIEPILKHLDYFFPNYEEARLISGKADVDEIADDFLKCGVKNVIIKLGKDGCLLKNNSECCRIEAYPVEKCVDTTGAGDNFAAAFISAILEGRSFVECGCYANAAASLCVEQTGATTAVTNRKLVDQRYDELIKKTGCQN